MHHKLMCVRYSSVVIPSITDFQHVGIIPVPGSRELLKAVLSESKFRHHVIVVANVIVCTPEVATHGGTPLPTLLHSRIGTWHTL